MPTIHHAINFNWFLKQHFDTYHYKKENWHCMRDKYRVEKKVLNAWVLQVEKCVWLFSTLPPSPRSWRTTFLPQSSKSTSFTGLLIVFVSICLMSNHLHLYLVNIGEYSCHLMTFRPPACCADGYEMQIHYFIKHYLCSGV